MCIRDRNLHGKIKFPVGAAESAPAPALGLREHALVAIGGGKDSLVSIEALRGAGVEQTVTWIGGSQLIKACAERTELPTLNLGRQLAPELFEYNRQGAWNGHIPVTAVNSAILVFAAVLLGVDQVVFSNERSASYGSLIAVSYTHLDVYKRQDLGRGNGHHEKVRTGGSEAKFGLPMAKAGDFVEAARGIGARVVALHAHLGSGIDNVAHWREVYADLAALAEQIGTVETIDIGGGLPVPYTPDARPFDVAGWAEGLAGIKAAYPRFALAIEPGRYLVAEAGVLLARVTQVVEKDGVRRIGLDAGMNTLVRPAMYDAWHAIHNLSRLDDEAVLPFDVVGPICESSDVFGHARMLPAATQEGDVVLIADAGAYGMAMASTYNLRALPLEEVVG